MVVRTLGAATNGTSISTKDDGTTSQAGSRPPPPLCAPCVCAVPGDNGILLRGGVGTKFVQGYGTCLVNDRNKGWLPGMDSNHDKNNPRIMCKLQSYQWPKMPHWTRKPDTRTQLVHGVLLRPHSRRVAWLGQMA